MNTQMKRTSPKIENNNYFILFQRNYHLGSFKTIAKNSICY